MTTPSPAVAVPEEDLRVPIGMYYAGSSSNNTNMVHVAQ
jgi:hypothetical protein